MSHVLTQASRFPVLVAGAAAAVMVLDLPTLRIEAAQSAAAEGSFRFEVATIKPSPPDAQGNTIHNNRGSFQIRNWPANWMIQPRSPKIDRKTRPIPTRGSREI